MKLLIVLIIIIPVVINSFNYNSFYTSKHHIEPQIDSLPDNLFYGLTAQKITTMEIEEIRKFCATKKIPLSQFVLTRTKAKNYLLKEKAKRDSIEVVKIYERIDKRLDIDK